jgi:hypothetical protein
MTGKKRKYMHTQINLVYNPIAALENKDRTNKRKSELVDLFVHRSINLSIGELHDQLLFPPRSILFYLVKLPHMILLESDHFM